MSRLEELWAKNGEVAEWKTGSRNFKMTSFFFNIFLFLVLGS
jgi:hypothetical protein